MNLIMAIFKLSLLFELFSVKYKRFYSGNSTLLLPLCNMNQTICVEDIIRRGHQTSDNLRVINHRELMEFENGQVVGFLGREHPENLNFESALMDKQQLIDRIMKPRKIK